MGKFLIETWQEWRGLPLKSPVLTGRKKIKKMLTALSTANVDSLIDCCNLIGCRHLKEDIN